MSVIPECPQCGQRMTPRTLLEFGDHGREVGINWYCDAITGGCGYQWAEYPQWFLEELEAKEKAEIEAEEALQEAYEKEWVDERSGYAMRLRRPRERSWYTFSVRKTIQELFEAAAGYPELKGYSYEVRTATASRWKFESEDYSDYLDYGKDVLQEGIL